MSKIDSFIPQGDLGNKAKAAVYVAIVVFVIVLVVIILKEVKGGFDGILEWMGLKDSPEKAAAKAKVANQGNANISQGTNSVWSPAFWQDKHSSDLLDGQTALNAIMALWDSVGLFYDDSQEGLGVFTSLKNQSQVSQICDAFQQNFGKNLYDFLQLHYDTGDQLTSLNKIIDIVNSLPNT